MRLKNAQGDVIATGISIAAAHGGWMVDDVLYLDNGYTVLDGSEAPTWEAAPAEYFWIDVGPFFDRFGVKALDITSSEDPQVRGVVTLCMPRKYIDLKRPDLPQMVGLLVAKGIITAGEKVAVLAMVTTEYERHIKGLPQPTE